MVLADADVFAGVMDSATLTFDDVAGLSKLATENLDAESFAFRLATVLRTTYTFFMCHVSSDFNGLCNYVFNHYLGEALAMAVETAITFAAFFLENDNFFTFHEGTFHLANNFCSFHGGSSDFHGTIGIDEEDAVEFDCVAFVNFFAEIVDIQILAGFGFELLSLDFYDYVHLLIC